MTPDSGANLVACPDTNSISLKGRDLITIEDLSGEEIVALVDRAIRRKSAIRQGSPVERALTGKHICLIFMRPSCRTRAAFSVAALDEGANPHAMSAEEIRLGQGESIRDIARVLSRMFAGIAIRTDDTATIREFARHADVPVWNAMSNEHHPTQALADIMTLRESGIIAGEKLAFVGHGRGNVCVSLMGAAAKTGLKLTIVTPPGCEPDPAVIARLQGLHPQAELKATTDVAKGVLGARAVYADMWVNMCFTGMSVEQQIVGFEPYRVTEELMRMTMQRGSIFLHCMPSQHNNETAFARAHPTALDTDDEVFEGPRSRVIDQAENRLHTIRALIAATA